MRWRRTAGTGACRLTVRPFLSGRDFGALHYENPTFRFDATTAGGNVAWRPYAEQPACTALTNGIYEHGPDWYRDFLYTEERDRGYNDTEDLGAPGVFSFDLATGFDAVMVLRTGDDLKGEAASLATTLAAAEQARRSAAPTRLARSALSYRVARGRGSTILAGFPWFSDWGRDTFISMRGLVLATGDLETAEAILLAWADMVSEGMLPNRFPDRGEEPEYNAVDASLWYVVAVHDFLDARAAVGRPVGETLGQSLRKACEAILEGYSAGTRFGIAAGPDGLVRAGTSGVAGDLDGRQDRRLCRDAPHRQAGRNPGAVDQRAPYRGPALGRPLARGRNQGPRQFRRAFHPARQYRALRRRGRRPCAGGRSTPKVRPNQIFAIGGLPFPILSGEGGPSRRRRGRKQAPDAARPAHARTRTTRPTRAITAAVWSSETAPIIRGPPGPG